MSAVSISSTSRPVPSSTTVSDWPCPSAPARSTTSVSPCLRLAIVGGNELGDARPQRVELARHELLGDDRLGARHLERRPVDELRERLHLDGRREHPGLLVARTGEPRTRTRAGVTGRSRARDAAAQNQPPMCDSTASAHSRSLPTFAISTGIGTFPLRKPGILTEPARSSAACSTAWWSSCGETSTVRRTRFSASCSTCGTRPSKQTRTFWPPVQPATRAMPPRGAPGRTRRR